MKRGLSILLSLTVGISASAQFTYPDNANKDMVRPSLRFSRGIRTEIILPKVNGYNTYKADLHTHTIFSDGAVTPGLRVREAWVDGLDVMAVTEHIEYRKHEPMLVKYLENYTKKGTEAVNYSISGKGPDKEGIKVDLNTAVRLAQEAAAEYGILIIPGTEVTRHSIDIGHYNALFTTDNNTIYDPDPLQSLRNAKAQGALVMHNHPGWTRKSLDMPEFEVKAYGEGLIDGIETMNGDEFYPKAIERAKELDLFVSANTDIHDITDFDYEGCEGGRNMTFIFAKEKTLEAMREALEARRTLSFSYDNIAGDEQLLKDFFLASMSFDGKNMTNTTSIPYAIRIGSSNIIWLKPFSTIMINPDTQITVENMWYGVDKHPVVEIKLQ